MNRYAIFAGQRYYPSGGIYDLFDTSDNILEAIEIIRKAFVPEPLCINDWAQLVEMDGELKRIGTISRDDLNSLLDVDSWLANYLKSITCSYCKEPPGFCICPGCLWYNGKPLLGTIEEYNQERIESFNRRMEAEQEERENK